MPVLTLQLYYSTPMSLRVGYLGPPGTYSHQAALQQFSKLETKREVSYLPQKSIAACFKSVNDGTIDYALVPFENSSNGQVVFTYDLFKEWFMNGGELKPKFKIISEQFVPIHHNLITYSDCIEKITKIYSHPQVWTQCREFLADLDVEKQDTSSTSKAVEILVQLNDHTTAAIASATASDVYNVPILQNNIEDNSNNTTRFLCLGHNPLSSSTTEEPNMHLVTFSIKENQQPGSLCDILAEFKSHGLNLASITTRPSSIPWQYVFFVEVWDGPGLYEVLENIKDLVTEVAVVGSFNRKLK